jgi:hypothetical protein
MYEGDFWERKCPPLLPLLSGIAAIVSQTLVLEANWGSIEIKPAVIVFQVKAEAMGVVIVIEICMKYPKPKGPSWNNATDLGVLLL